jgi:hypothetical protein
LVAREVDLWCPYDLVAHLQSPRDRAFAEGDWQLDDGDLDILHHNRGHSNLTMDCERCNHEKFHVEIGGSTMGFRGALTESSVPGLSRHSELLTRKRSRGSLLSRGSHGGYLN